MWIVFLLLLLPVLGAGWAAGRLPTRHSSRWLKPLLAFSGAYLFTLTITHILPEALTLDPAHPHRVGYWVLAGFFGQMLLELVSQGVEHGHVHLHPPAQGHVAGLTSRVPLGLLGALGLHSFLEGSILLVNTNLGGEVSSNFYAIAAGVALHHMPAAFALATLLRLRLGRTGRAWPWLVLFALASPAGLVVGNYLVPAELLRGGLFAALLGLVAGSFLHVSTTILFETSPEHTLNWPKLAATLMGLALALAVA